MYDELSIMFDCPPPYSEFLVPPLDMRGTHFDQHEVMSLYSTICIRKHVHVGATKMKALGSNLGCFLG
jgi:hypothetical protein